jgi:hypothetical protein
LLASQLLLERWSTCFFYFHEWRRDWKNYLASCEAVSDRAYIYIYIYIYSYSGCADGRIVKEVTHAQDCVRDQDVKENEPTHTHTHREREREGGGYVGEAMVGNNTKQIWMEIMRTIQAAPFKRNFFWSLSFFLLLFGIETVLSRLGLAWPALEAKSMSPLWSHPKQSAGRFSLS